MTVMLIRFNEMTTGCGDESSQIRCILTPYRTINVANKTVRDIVHGYKMNGKALNERNCGLRINQTKTKESDWSVPFVDAVAQSVAGEGKSHLNVPLTVTVAIRKKSPDYPETTRLLVKVRPCLLNECTQCTEFHVTVNLEYDTIKQLELAIYEHLPCVAPGELMIGLNNEQLDGNKHRNAPLWWFDLKENSTLTIHNHVRGKPCAKTADELDAKTEPVSPTLSSQNLQNGFHVTRNRTVFVSLIQIKEENENELVESKFAS
jgi:hypothetical protein